MKTKTRERNLVQDLGGWEGEEGTAMRSSCAVVTAVSQSKVLMCCVRNPLPSKQVLWLQAVRRQALDAQPKGNTNASFSIFCSMLCVPLRDRNSFSSIFGP